LLDAFEKQNDPPDSRRKIIRKIADFFDVTDVDDAIFDTLHEQIREILQLRFRSFVRTCISKADLVDMNFVLITESHGFHYQWQRTVIDNIARNLHDQKQIDKIQV